MASPTGEPPPQHEDVGECRDRPGERSSGGGAMTYLDHAERVGQDGVQHEERPHLHHPHISSISRAMAYSSRLGGCVLTVHAGWEMGLL